MPPDQTWQAAVTTARPVPALGRHVVDHLRRLIIVGDVPAGTHLVEVDLSAMFDVSRGPVRDALRQLQTEGLVESRRRGVFVIGLSPDDIDELYNLRQVLEAEAIRLCMQQKTDYSTVRAAVERMRSAAESGDVDRFAEADLDFHTGFYALSGHRRLTSIWEQYRPTFADMLAVTNTVDRDLAPTCQDHADLLGAVEHGDQATVMSMLAEHVEGSHRRMLTAYQQHIATS